MKRSIDMASRLIYLLDCAWDQFHDETTQDRCILVIDMLECILNAFINSMLSKLEWVAESNEAASDEIRIVRDNIINSFRNNPSILRILFCEDTPSKNMQ